MPHHFVKRTDVERLRPAVEGALKDCIYQHGPIENRWISSAAKRITGNIRQWLDGQDETVAELLEERKELRRHISVLEKALKRFVGPGADPDREDIMHAQELIYGRQEWIHRAWDW